MPTGKKRSKERAKARQAIMCDICKFYVATARPNAAQPMVERAFALAIDLHLEVLHPNDKESVTFSYGMRSM